MTGTTRPDVRTTLVVVPTYDERDNVEEAVRRVLHADPRVEVLVVDDGSPDGTADLVDALRADESRLHLVRREGKGGLGSANRAGFGWALERGYDAVVEMDADLSHPADRLPALLDGLADADLVIGSRWVPGGATVGWPLSRRLLSRGGNLYVRLLLRLGVGDATAGFRAFRREALETMDAVHLASEGYSFQVESTYVARRLGLRLVEVPITFTERVEGDSKMSTRIVLEALLRVTGWAVGGASPGGDRCRGRRDARCTTGDGGRHPRRRGGGRPRRRPGSGYRGCGSRRSWRAGRAPDTRGVDLHPHAVRDPVGRGVGRLGDAGGVGCGGGARCDVERCVDPGAGLGCGGGGGGSSGGGGDPGDRGAVVVGGPGDRGGRDDAGAVGLREGGVVDGGSGAGAAGSGGDRGARGLARGAGGVLPALGAGGGGRGAGGAGRW